MNQPKTKVGAPRLPDLAIAAGAIAAGVSPGQVTYGQAVAPKPFVMQGPGMTPGDQEFILAKVDARLSDLRGDVRLNTSGVSELKARLDELARQMATVPADVASLKATVAELPRKGFIVTATTGALVAVAALSTFVQWVLSLQAAAGVAHP